MAYTLSPTVRLAELLNTFTVLNVPSATWAKVDGHQWYWRMEMEQVAQTSVLEVCGLSGHGAPSAVFERRVTAASPFSFRSLLFRQRATAYEEPRT